MISKQEEKAQLLLRSLMSVTKTQTRSDFPKRTLSIRGSVRVEALTDKMRGVTLLLVVGIVLVNLLLPTWAYKRLGKTRETLRTKSDSSTFIRDQRKSISQCPHRNELGNPLACPNKCTSDVDCSAKKGEKCLCFGECGLSCINKRKAYCKHPEHVENGKILIVGPTGPHELANPHEKVPEKGHILFQCDAGFVLADGPLGKSCENGNWVPIGKPKCISVTSRGFSWLHAGRVKRRAIKTGGSSTIVRGGSKGPGNSNTGLGPRRGFKKKGSRPDDDEYEPTPIFCPNLDDLDDYLQIQVIQSGEDHNETFSAGAIVKVSCTSGFGVNVPNETVRCDKGKWRPKIPQCSALPCKTPFLDNAVFYEGSKPLYFQEIKKHKTVVDVKCKKGYKLRGPQRFHCWFGEWDVQDSPECLPAPCTVPVLDFGQYLINYRSNTSVQHGIEVDYICGGDYKKVAPGSVRCDLGEWKPNKPFCYRSSAGNNPVDSETRKGGKKVEWKPPTPVVKRPCGPPPKENGSYIFEGGLPIDWNKQATFQDSTDVLYRCTTLRAKARNRWKLTCENGTWTGIGNLTCDSTAPRDQFMSLPDVNMINSSCVFRKTDPFVVTFYNDQIINQYPMEFPHGTITTSRCLDIGKFRLEGAVRRKCLSGQWMGITPRCEGLSQIHDYAHDKSPTILFRFVNGSIVQSNDGDLIVYPGTTLHMECLWLRKFGKPRWDTSNKHKEYPEGWAAGERRDSSLEYRLTIENAQSEDSGTYSCVTPTRHSTQIKIIVKASSCQPLPPHPELEYSTNATILGTRVVFTCRFKNSLIGAREIFCSESGRWSAPLPRCENVECPNISLLPAMAPLAYTSITKNGTLKKNETAPPRISVESTQVGGKATFSCPPGYMIEGAKVAYCNDTGEWSAPMPLCKEVECSEPPELENGEATGGKPPYKPGNLATYECDAGFVLEGQHIIACQDNGKWSKSHMKCSTSCSYQGTVIHGSLLSNMKFNYEVGETVEFQCNDGYSMTGSRKLKCLKTGEWSAPIPTCNLCEDGQCNN